MLKGVVVCEDFCVNEGEGVADSFMDDVTVKEFVVNSGTWDGGGRWRMMGVCLVGSLRIVIMSLWSL